MIIIGSEGFGKKSLIKLACFISEASFNTYNTFKGKKDF